jgi:septal ring factor EnvC (AmiA/AmiB activator)
MKTPWSPKRAHEELIKRLDHQHEHLLEIKQAQEAQAKLLARTFRKVGKMSAELDRLTTEVAETKTAVASVLALVEGLAQQIRDNATDPVALNKLADDLDAAQQDIAAAVTANTPPTP